MLITMASKRSLLLFLFFSAALVSATTNTTDVATNIVVPANFTVSLVNVSTYSLPGLTSIKAISYDGHSVYIVNNEDGRIYVRGPKSYSISTNNLDVVDVLSFINGGRNYIYYNTPFTIYRNNPVRKSVDDYGVVSLERIEDSIIAPDSYGHFTTYSLDLGGAKTYGGYKEYSPFLSSTHMNDTLYLLQNSTENNLVVLEYPSFNKLRQCTITGIEIATDGYRLYSLANGTLYVYGLSSCEQLSSAYIGAGHIANGNGTIFYSIPSKVVEASISLVEVVNEPPKKEKKNETKTQTPALQPSNTTTSHKNETSKVEQQPQESTLPYGLISAIVVAVILAAILFLVLYALKHAKR